MSDFQLKIPSAMIFLGKTMSGKSYFMKWLLEKVVRTGKLSNVIVLSGSSFNSEWAQIVGEERVLELSEDTIKSVLDRLADIRRSGRQEQTIMLIDDSIGQLRFQNDTWRKLASMGRHFNLSVWVSTQRYTALPPIVRDNAAAVCCLGPLPKSTLKLLHEEKMLSVADDLDSFINLYKNSTANYNAMIIPTGGDKHHIVKAEKSNLKL